MAEAVAEPVAFVAEKMTLSAEVLQVLTSGDASRLVELLRSDGQTKGHVAIKFAAALPSGPPVTSSCCLLGVTSNGNTALHLAASRGHAKLAALICEASPSLVATRNRALDTRCMHCAARGGHREVAACLLSTLLSSSGVEETAALRATNRMGDTALHDAVRHRRADAVDLFMAEAPDLASVTSDDGVSALYLAATAESVQMVRLLLRPLPDGTPSPASSADHKGRTALHAAAAISKEMVEDRLAWKPEGPALLTRVDSSGRTPLHFAVRAANVDVVELFLNVDSSLAQISDNNGWYPVHCAAAREPRDSARIIDELINKCPESYEFVDDKGWNLLHLAVVTNNDTVVRYICENERFAMLLNTTDFQGNTPLHLAVKYGYTRIVSILLQTRVDVNANNRDGLTARDLAYDAFPWGRLEYLLEPAVMIYHCLCWAGARRSLNSIDLHKKDDVPAKENSAEKDYTKGTIASALIASVTFAAAFTVPGGFIADDHPHPGTAILASRFAFRAFVVSDTLAFLCSILATGFYIYGGVSELPHNLRREYTITAFALVTIAAEFMIAAFTFGLHLVLGVADRWLALFVYTVSSASVLYFAWNTLVHASGFVKVIWWRAGWKGILNMHKRPSGPLQLLRRLASSPLVKFAGGSIALPLCAIFFITFKLEIALPNS